MARKLGAIEPDGDREQVALFDIEGPDEKGNVWIYSPPGVAELWCQNLGPSAAVAEKLSRWLEQIAGIDSEASAS
jgi:hypothetical protein